MNMLREFFWVLNGLIAVSLLIVVFDLDRMLAALVCIAGEGLHTWQRWPGIVDPFWRAIYYLAPIPASLMGIFALGLLLSAGFKKIWRPWLPAAGFFLLLLALGPGVLVNLILKDHLGRPRPIQLLDFGGVLPYVHLWQFGAGKRNSSFPSGHAAIAFVCMGPWFFLRQFRRKAALACLSLALLWGFVVGAGRILQGAHFLSDVIWSGGLIYLLGLLLSAFLGFD